MDYLLGLGSLRAHVQSCLHQLLFSTQGSRARLTPALHPPLDNSAAPDSQLCCVTSLIQEACIVQAHPAVCACISRLLGCKAVGAHGPAMSGISQLTVKVTDRHCLCKSQGSVPMAFAGMISAPLCYAVLGHRAPAAGLIEWLNHCTASSQLYSQAVSFE